MSVEELIQELKTLPQSATVMVRVRMNVSFDGLLEPLYEYRDEQIDSLLYHYGEVIIHLDENSGVRVP